VEFRRRTVGPSPSFKREQKREEEPEDYPPKSIRAAAEEKNPPASEKPGKRTIGFSLKKKAGTKEVNFVRAQERQEKSTPCPGETKSDQVLLAKEEKRWSSTQREKNRWPGRWNRRGWHDLSKA